MVQVTISGIGELQGSEADVIESLIINAVSLICVLNKLMDREGGIVGLNNCVRDLGGGDNRVGVHDSVGVFFTDFGDQECSHSRSGSTSQRVSELESLEAVGGLSLFSDNIQNRINELSTWRK